MKENVWYHVVSTFRSGKAKIYLDGKLLETRVIGYTDLPLGPNRDLRFGMNHPGAYEYYNGLIDNVRIYNRVLGDNEILQLYKREKERDQRDL